MLGSPHPGCLPAPPFDSARDGEAESGRIRRKRLRLSSVIRVIPALTRVITSQGEVIDDRTL